MKVLKRDGNTECFDAEKLNKWAEWASENCGVSWSDVILEASRQLHDNVSTTDIHKALIEVCVNRKDTGHSRMAARLFVGQIYKEAFQDYSIPSLKYFYYEMVEYGYWDDLGYTDEELEQVDSAIEHTLDLTYEYCTIRQFYDKYAISAYGRCLESPQMALMGVAMSNTRNEESRVQAAINCYKELCQLKINLPTPSLSGQRTKQSGSPSCCLISGGDSVDSIEAAVHVAYKMTALSSGIGAELEIRAPKDPVKSGTIEHQGKLAYYRYLDRAVKANRQHSRGGSATVTFTALDPEIDSLLRLKSQRVHHETRIDTMDYSLGIVTSLLRRAAKDEDWMLVSCFNAPKLHELLYSSDVEAFEKEYAAVEKSSVTKTFVKARSVINLFFSQRSDNGRIYKTNFTNVNTHTPFKEPIRLSNLCVVPETQILTDKGYLTIGKLEGESVNVWNGEEWSNVEVVKTGENQDVIEVVTDFGHSLECTPYHKFYVQPSDYDAKVVEKRAFELKSGDKLMKFDLPVIEGNKELKKAYTNGFYSGDGCFDKGRSKVYLYHEKRKLKDFLEHEGTWYVQDEQNRDSAFVKGLKDKFFVPDASYTIESRLNWLAGYLDADGVVARNGTNHSIQCTSVEPEFLKEMQLMLQTLGIQSKICEFMEEGDRLLPLNNGTGESGYFLCRKSQRLLISSSGLYKLSVLGFKTNRLTWEQRLPQRNAERFTTIKEVNYSGRKSDTFCFKEQKRGMGMFNGILTGQCQEVLLVTKKFDNVVGLYNYEGIGEVALCFLASIVAGRVKFEDYENTAYEAAKFVDNTIEQSTYPFPAIEVTAKARRSIGIGVTNVAAYMAEGGWKYDTEEGRNALHRLAEIHSYSLHKASVRLAKERGKCEWFHKTKYSDNKPWLPIDTYSKEVDNHHTQELLCDWEGLREDIKKYGTRFSVHEAYMPVESSSVFTASTNGVYPIREKKIFKKSKKGTVYFEAPNIETIGNQYQNAYDIATEDMIIVYSIFQKFCGQSISADFYQKVNDGQKMSMSDQYKNLFFAAKMGMKTWYYLNSKTGETESDVETVDIDEEACDSCTL